MGSWGPEGQTLGLRGDVKSGSERDLCLVFHLCCVSSKKNVNIMQILNITIKEKSYSLNLYNIIIGDAFVNFFHPKWPRKAIIIFLMLRFDILVEELKVWLVFNSIPTRICSHEWKWSLTRNDITLNMTWLHKVAAFIFREPLFKSCCEYMPNNKMLATRFWEAE